MNQHSDDLAVDRFATAMKEELAQARAKGRCGWEECAPADLSAMLYEHVEKGDPRDVANFCMFLWSLGQPITPCHKAPAVAQEPVGEIQIEDMGQPFNAMRVRVHFYKEVPQVGAKIYTEAPAVAQEALGWRVAFTKAPRGNFQEGQPDDSTREYWRKQGVGFEYCYAQPPAEVVREPVDWADLLHEAQSIVESKSVYKKFIKHTPLDNDIAVWMADFAESHTPPAPAVAQEPVVQRTLGYKQGIQDAAKKLDTKADDYAKEFGFDDMGALEFSREAQREYHSTLIELAEEIRSMEATNSTPTVAQLPAEVVRELVDLLKKVQGQLETGPDSQSILMQAWDRAIAHHRGQTELSDLPRMAFESVLDSFSEEIDAALAKTKEHGL